MVSISAAKMFEGVDPLSVFVNTIGLSSPGVVNELAVFKAAMSSVHVLVATIWSAVSTQSSEESVGPQMPDESVSRYTS
jgi:hypothetical protein